jgi:hypothetical protein
MQGCCSDAAVMLQKGCGGVPPAKNRDDVEVVPTMKKDEVEVLADGHHLRTATSPYRLQHRKIPIFVGDTPLLRTSRCQNSKNNFMSTLN